MGTQQCKYSEEMGNRKKEKECGYQAKEEGSETIQAPQPNATGVKI